MSMRNRVTDMARITGAMFVWFVSGAFFGLLATLYGPGAAGVIAGLFLGFCGMSLHLVLWAIQREPHWSYAGLVFGLFTTVVMLIITMVTDKGNDSWQPVVVLILFLVFSLLSYIIYPIVSRVLSDPRK